MSVLVIASIMLVLGFMILQCESPMSDGTVYKPFLEAAIIWLAALSLLYCFS